MPEELAKSRRDAAMARIAARQHGVLSVPQLKGCGFSSSAIGDRVKAGRLHRIHRGVYAVGHAGIGDEGRWMAAVLACGEGAVLSHRSAAELWSILRVRRPSGAGARALPDPVDVTVPGDSGRAKRAGVRLHRSLTLSPADCALHEGIPVTKPARTLEDLRRVLSAKQFAAALREAEFLGLPTGERLRPDHTRSELESRFLSPLPPAPHSPAGCQRPDRPVPRGLPLAVRTPHRGGRWLESRTGPLRL